MNDANEIATIAKHLEPQIEAVKTVALEKWGQLPEGCRVAFELTKVKKETPGVFVPLLLEGSVLDAAGKAQRGYETFRHLFSFDPARLQSGDR